MSMISLNEMASELGQLKQATVLCHVFPDADAVGSAAGLALVLEQAGVDASVFLADEMPQRMKNLAEEVTVSETVPEGGTLVVVDTANRERVSIGDQSLLDKASEIFNIDHHVSNSGWGNKNLVVGDYPSASCIVMELALAMKVKPTPAILNLLYAGLVEDTGSFRFSNATPVAFSSASKMVEMGAMPEIVANELFFNVPDRVVKLRGIAIPLISGILGAVMIREREGSWKVSLRSKSDNLDVNHVAGLMGGGGHKAAAGCTLNGELDVVKKTVLDKLAKAINS